jgi:uncharacterized phage-associated protein
MNAIFEEKFRNPEEAIVDKVLLLYLIKKAEEKGRIWGITKLMKLVFFAERKMVKYNVKGFNYNFYRWHLGPFTPEVYEDLEYLIETDLVAEREGIEVTNHGVEILKAVEQLLKENENVLEYIEELVGKYASERTSELMKLAYETEVEIMPFKIKAKVRDVPVGYNLVTKLGESEARDAFEIDDAWLETLDILLDTQAYESLKDAMASARTRSSKRVVMIEL